MFKEARELIKLQQQAKQAQKKLKKEVVEVETKILIDDQEFDLTFSIKADMSDVFFALNGKKHDKISKVIETGILEAQKKASNLMQEDMFGEMGNMGKLGEMMKKFAK